MSDVTRESSSKLFANFLNAPALTRKKQLYVFFQGNRYHVYAEKFSGKLFFTLIFDICGKNFENRARLKVSASGLQSRVNDVFVTANARFLAVV